MKLFGKEMTRGATIGLFVLIAGVIFGSYTLKKKLFPEKAKIVTVTTQATKLPPLAYDKSANAPFRAVPQFNTPASVEAPEVRAELMGWNAQMGIMYAVGGSETSQGSLCQELGLNMHLSVQNSTDKQGDDLYAMAQGLHSGDANPSSGCHMIAWMGDGVPNYFAGLNARLIKDFGPEYIAQVIGFGGASFGEDKWLLKPKFSKDPRGSLTVTVLRDGDWNIAIMKCQMIKCPVNYTSGTFDPTKANFIAAPGNDYMEAARFYASGQTITLKLIKNGKITDKDTTLATTGVATWFPGDLLAVTKKGGLVTAGSTADFGAQMGNAIIVIKKWAQDNRKTVENLLEAIGKGGDQVKSHDEALMLACKVSQLVYADENMTDEDYHKAYLGYDVTDDNDNVVKVGGSRVFNLADVANYIGIGSSDKYKTVYNTFGKICVESYPELLSTFPPYEEVTDWSYFKAVYLKNKETMGTASKTEFHEGDKVNQVVADADYSIQFETGSAIIKAESYPILDNIVNQVTVADNLLVEVGGHTDNTGTPEGNVALSQARAQAVKTYLLSKGNFESNRIKSKGYGQSKPIGDNLTVSGRQTNRRVEIKLGRK